MLKLMPIPHALHVKETIPTSRRTNNCGGTCSPVDQTYMTAMPGVATSAMAEHYTKTDSIGLQLQAECWYEQSMIQLPFPSTIKAQRGTVTFLTIKIMVRKNPEKQQSDRLMRLDKTALGQGGRGGLWGVVCSRCSHFGGEEFT